MSDSKRKMARRYDFHDLMELFRGSLLLQFFDTNDALILRLVCRRMRLIVSIYPWTDAETLIRGNLTLWRQCFPHAIAANVSGRKDLVDHDFVLFRDIKQLRMNNCGECKVTDAAFVNLCGIHTLEMNGCPQFTNAALLHVNNVHTLSINECTGFRGRPFELITIRGCLWWAFICWK
jgi:hypothetical protein